ncbi:MULTISPECIES: DUF6412 domain-containing protein [Agromyces]|jgi:hypothetical protein|uniref:DUF6412 domain-containing protein n=1 Tax=Agromyces TaxID=33877 RepID=UPI001E64165D|nr:MULTISPECIES: DUF6412 domain-containing protein [Agromyces]MCD1570613.1 DUF6412 domain-containing protein [Agromyces mediolanus]GLU89050.1 hypothetical protein Agsp01_13050 [Agromyces sp. NBRC 114283]
MIELLTNLLRFLAAAFELGAAANGQLSVLLLGVVGAAAVAVVVLSVRALPALVAADPAGAATRLRQTADPWRLLSQSDPDAPGRARPRAPGLAVSAA